jgi:hypothetical protein
MQPLRLLVLLAFGVLCTAQTVDPLMAHGLRNSRHWTAVSTAMNLGFVIGHCETRAIVTGKTAADIEAATERLRKLNAPTPTTPEK